MTHSSPQSTDSTAPSSAVLHNPVLENLIAQEEAIRRQLEDIQRAKDEAANAEVNALRAKVNGWCAEMKVQDHKELCKAVMNLFKDHSSKSKGKRLSPESLRLMEKVLRAGASVPEVCRHFRVSEACVNSWKAKWKLTHREHVKRIPLGEALKKAR